MMDMIDTWMVLVFPFLDFMPFGLPRYWLFRDRLRIPFRYITVLLGNLLENAVEACKRQANTAQTIKLRIKQRGGSALLILVDNPCLTPVVFDGDMPLSSKRKGAGIGTYSVREIAVRYGGTAQFEQKAGVFYASVLLNIVPYVTGKEAPAGNVCLPK